MGCCLSMALCCCCQQACQCLCACCPSYASSAITKIAYMIFLIIGIVIACIFTTPIIAEQLLKIEGFCNTSALYIPTQPVAECSKMTSSLKSVLGFPAAYRISFAWAAFFLLMMILTIGIKSSKDCRTGIQNGFWFFKVLIVIGAAIGALFIHEPNFDLGLMIVGGIGAFIFYIIQMALLIDIAYKWTGWWMGRYEEADRKIWLVGVIFFSVIFYAMFLGLVIVLYIFYANGDCPLHKFFISFNFILCIALSILSVLPFIQKHNPRSGLLQSSIVSLYIMYITWTAVNSSSTCNPLSTCSQQSPTQMTPEQCISTTFSYDVIVPLVVLLLCVIYTSFTNGSKGVVDTIGGSTEKQEESAITTDKSGGGVTDDEEDGCRYNYSFLHFIFMLSVLFTMMTITHWITPNVKEVNTAPAVWVKMSSSWLGLTIYLWTLIAPLVLRNRTFA